MNQNDNLRDTLSTWLKDAYAMEQGIVEILEKQLGQFDDMPEAQAKIRQHLELTRDLALRLNQLKFYQRAVANAILDHKMHCAGMTDAEALEFLTRRAYQSEGEARLKIVRAKQSSVQLSTYFAGRTAMYNLRQAIQQERGEKFKLGRYHEALLLCGPVPVKYLPKLVRRQLR